MFTLDANIFVRDVDIRDPHHFRPSQIAYAPLIAFRFAALRPFSALRRRQGPRRLLTELAEEVGQVFVVRRALRPRAPRRLGSHSAS